MHFLLCWYAVATAKDYVPTQHPELYNHQRSKLKILDYEFEGHETEQMAQWRLVWKLPTSKNC